MMRTTAGALEEEFYEVDFPLTNPETHNIGTKSQQRAYGTEVQNERSVERDFLFVFTATNKKIDLEMKLFRAFVVRVVLMCARM